MSARLIPLDATYEPNWASRQAQGLVRWMPTRDFYGGKTLRDRLYAATGTLTGGVKRQYRPDIGTLLAFDGSTGYVGIGGSTVPVADAVYSISLWASTNTPLTRQAIVGDWDADAGNQGACVEFGGWSQIAGNITTNQRQGTTTNYLDSNVTAVAGVLYHIAVTWYGTGSTVRWIYVNGIARNNKAALGCTAGNSLSLGRGGAYNGLYLNGIIADFRLYNRPLTAAEVWALYAPDTRNEMYLPVRRVFAVPAAAPAAPAVSSARQRMGIGLGLRL